MHSAVLIVPAALKPAADALGASMGWGRVSYTIALGPAGAEVPSVTHYGLQAQVSEQFIRWVHGIDPLPDPAAQPVIDALIADFATDPTRPEDQRHGLSYRAHLRAVLDGHDLAEV